MPSGVVRMRVSGSAPFRSFWAMARHVFRSGASSPLRSVTPRGYGRPTASSQSKASASDLGIVERVTRSPDLYVRHAMPAKREGVAPAEWRLGPEGHIAALALAGWLRLLDPPMLVVTSPEPKAAETAAPLAEQF